MVSRHATAPGQAHITAVKRIFRYLWGTSDYKLTYRWDKAGELVVYSDSDWAGDKMDRKSTSGFVAMLNGGPVVWGSKKPALHSRALRLNLLPWRLQLRNLFGSEDFFLPLTISLAPPPPYSLTIKRRSRSSKMVSAQSTASTSSFTTTLFVKNSLMGQLPPNTSLQMSSWPTVSPKLLLASNTRNSLKNSVLLEECLLSGHVVIHLSCVCLASCFLCIRHHILSFQTYFLT